MRVANISLLLQHPYFIQQTGNENTQIYQAEVVIVPLTPNSRNLLTRNCITAGGQINNQVIGNFLPY